MSALETRRGVTAALVPAPSIRGVGVLTGWGEGLSVLARARRERGGALVTVPTPALAGERFRRATRECVLGVAAVGAALVDGGLDASRLAGDRTGVLYVSATAYAAANRAFLEDEGSATLHFPYTAPSAVPGEVTIEFGIRGPYVNLIGGGTATFEGLWYAAHWLAEGVADRVLVLAVETVHAVWDLLLGVPRLCRRPLIEGAACVLLEPGRGDSLAWASVGVGSSGAAAPAVLEAVLGAEAPRQVARCSTGRGVRQAEEAVLARHGAAAACAVGELGETFACGPLIGLGEGRASGLAGPCLLTATWLNDYGAILWPL